MKSILISSSLLILLIAALRPLLRGRIDPRAQYALWLAAALRLLVPVNFADSAYSALALLERADRGQDIVETIGQTTVPIPGMSYGDAYDQALREYHQDRPTSFTDLTEVERRAQEIQAKSPTLADLAAKYARPVRLGGAAVMGAWLLLVNLRLRRRLGSALPVEADCPLPVYVTPELPSPCLCGVFRPAVYVTPAALESRDRLRHVLAHETTHCRHRDHWWALVRCLCLCLYWFDPLVWWAAALSRQDCELACDEGAIRRLGEPERIPYGRTLVAMIAAGRNPLLQAATTMTGGKRRMRERVRLIARRPKTVTALALALAAVLGLAVGCAFTGAPAESAEPAPSAGPDAAPQDAPSLPQGTLRERLLDIPEELQGSVIDRSSNSGQAGVLVDYWLNTPDDWEDGLGWVFGVKKLNRVEFEDFLYTIPTGNVHVFAQDGESYYAINRPTDVRFAPETAELYSTARELLMEYAMEQVLSTEGITPFDEEEQRSRVQFEGKTYTSVAYWPYKAVNGSTDVVWIYHLVQPVKDGPSGVWVPEREELYDPGFPCQSYLIKPDTGGLTVLEYAEKLQAEADAGNADWATDPIQVLIRYVASFGPGHHGRGADSFTQDSAYIESVRAGALPTPEQQAIQAMMDKIVNADEISLTLAPGGTSRVYAYSIPSLDKWQDGQVYWAPYRLDSLAGGFQWEKLDALPEGMNDTCLTIQPDGGPDCVWLWDAFNLVAIRTPDNRIEYYQAVSDQYGDALGNYSPFQRLRAWFDEVELLALRTTSVPDRGQSHEDVVKQWLEGCEGACLKCAPGGHYTCTYVRAENVRVDQPEGMTPEQLEDFCRSRLPAEDFTKTWFGFSYSLIFVPENENAKQQLQAGNTEDYAGSDAPEGAQICYRVAYMRLVDGSWVCQGTGTGW